MIPNKTEQQILYQNFKFFDLEGAGFCNIKDFIKANEKIGVVLGHIQDFQDIFNYFDTDKIGVINYRQFCKTIFNMKEQKNKQFQSNVQSELNYQERKTNNRNDNKRKEPFFDKLVNILIQNGGAISLISLFKEFKLLDFNNANRLTIDDFIKIISENKIGLSISEIQLLFHSYEFNSNGFFYYDELFKDLKQLFWNNNRAKEVEKLYDTLTQGNNSPIMVNDLKEIFSPKKHPYVNTLRATYLYDTFQMIVNYYLSIKRMNRGNFQLSKNDFEDFFTYYSFGIVDDFDFINIINNCFLPTDNTINNYPVNNVIKQERIREPSSSNYNTSQENNQSGIENIIAKFKKSLQNFGLKTVFGLMKHFKYYDNGTKMITKYDFAKVLKDFRLNLTISEIERIFDTFCQDPKKIQMNYEEFITSLTSSSINDNRIKKIEEIFDKLNNYSKGIGEKVSVDLIKSMYWAKDNYFGIEENLALNEFCDNIEMFHYSVKGNKTPLFTKNEFCDFYSLISFIIDSDSDFIAMINTEWKKVINEPNQNEKYIEPSNNKFTELNNQTRKFSPMLQSRKEEEQKQFEQKPSSYIRSRPSSRSHTPIRQKQNIIEPIIKLETQLKRRGIRGLMNLHKQFLFSCPNLAFVTLNDFIKVLTLQRINLESAEYEQLFSKYTQEDNQELLNFPGFIRAFKRILNDNRLRAVENAFGRLDKEQTESLFIDDIKLKFNPKNHPDVVNCKKNEDEIITEFLDCFELNYNLLTTAENPETSNMVSFEEFANFYEYVSFLYSNDSDFIQLVEGSWNY